MPHIFVTGARTGIGLECVKVFANHGWRVTAACRGADQFPEEAKKENVHPISLDVLNTESIEQVRKQLGGQAIDVLLHVAGIFDTVSNSVDDDILFTDISDITRVFQTNAIAPRVITERFLPNLLLGKERLVVTISSVMGTFAKMDDYHAKHWVYGSSKAAVTYAMTAFAKSYPEIKSVLIHPGWVKTHMGGNKAPLDSVDVAEKIYHLIANHVQRLQSGVFVDNEGNVMER